jgi:putative tryptophan/tyrosine transport system substrate-binding protein
VRLRVPGAAQHEAKRSGALQTRDPGFFLDQKQPGSRISGAPLARERSRCTASGIRTFGRREFITLIGGAAVAWPLAARAQQSGRVRRVGMLMPYPKGDSETEARVGAFKQELAKLGWTEGGNVRFDERWTTDNMDRVRGEAAALVASNPDIIVTYGGRVVPVFMRLTRSIPIVLPSASDPVGVGYAQSLARPGGNVTGFTAFELSMLGKSLEILKQIAPAVARVALIYNPDNPNSVHYRRISEAASAPLAIEAIDRPIHGLADIERAVASLAERGNGGIFFLPDLTTTILRDEILALVARRRVPAIYSEPFFVKLGGLAFYGADRMEGFRRSAGYVDRILRGEKPGDLPFQQPTKYELMINRKTAKALGLELSPALLALADEVIE